MAQWNFNCPDCIHYKPLETCPFTACQFTPVQIVTTNKIQIVEAFQIIKELAKQFGKEKKKDIS